MATAVAIRSVADWPVRRPSITPGEWNAALGREGVRSMLRLCRCRSIPRRRVDCDECEKCCKEHAGGRCGIKRCRHLPAVMRCVSGADC